MTSPAIPALFDAVLPMLPGGSFRPDSLLPAGESLGELRLIQLPAEYGERRVGLYVWTGISWAVQAQAAQPYAGGPWRVLAADHRRRQVTQDLIYPETGEQLRAWLVAHSRPRDLWAPPPLAY